LELPLSFAGLKFHNGEWRSTVELIRGLQRELERDNAWVEGIYPMRSFAGNNAWSPSYTSEQLQNMCQLVLRD
jgi:hypothetical protein